MLDIVPHSYNGRIQEARQECYESEACLSEKSGFHASLENDKLDLKKSQTKPNQNKQIFKQISSILFLRRVKVNRDHAC